MTQHVDDAETTAPPIGPWDVFEQRIAAYLSTMFDTDDRLQLHVPTTVNTEPWVIDIQKVADRDVIRIDYRWDEVFLRRDDPADLTHRLRCVIERERFRLPHPQLLTVSASGPAAAGIGVLGLGVRDNVPGQDGARSVLFTSTREQVLGALLNHVRSEYDKDAELDEDDDIPLTVNGVRLWAGVGASKPSILLFSRVVDDARSRRQACVDVNGLNRNRHWSRWVCRDHSVWQQLTIPSLIFQPQLFDEMLQVFVADYLGTQLDLADRLGGQPASG